jgi:uncharacterized RDD family membrane protein YckC
MLGAVSLVVIGTWLALAAYLGLPILYFALFESSSWRATPGKRLFGLQVAEELTGRRISSGNAALRTFVRYGFGIGLIVNSLAILLTAKGQGIHDKAAGTVVFKASNGVFR